MNVDPIATYRIQLTQDFTLHDAAGILPYLAQLGVDFLYTSPCLQAAPSSLSGYDVIDPGRVNRELGGQEGHDALSNALRLQHMSRMIDIVPNHMAISSGHNPWWHSVLKHGQSSEHADWFDVDWESSAAHWPNRVLLPVLGNQFGRVLEAGELKLRHWEGQFSLHYYDNTFPVEPSSTAGILAQVAETLRHQQLAFYAESLRRLPRPSVSMQEMVDRRHRETTVLAYLLARLCREEPAVVAAIDAETERLNSNVQGLGELIEAQNYRLADWRAAALDLGYRRFFNINSLVGLRVELPEVFDALHALPLEWLREGQVQAIRVDHPDGLRDPAGYLQRLRKAAPNSWIVVEKILEPGEKLPDDWPVEGTTGYDFADAVQGLFVNAAHEETMTRCYYDFIGEDTRYQEVLQASKRCVLKDLLGSEMARLTSLLWDVCERHWRHRDFTRDIFTRVITEIALGFEVYRTYVRPGVPVSPVDRSRIETAVAAAGRAIPALDAELLQFVQQLLLLEVPGTLEEEFALRFQQLTGPAMAKGLEDTAFYRYVRLTALNEVGGDPGRWSTSPADFHAWCETAQRERPYSMLATSTHDSKRSEDVRARLLVLSEMPQRWREAVQRWRGMNEDCRGARIDANAEYLFYQSLVGAWPIEEERVQAYMLKALREAKVHTEWTSVDEEYESQWRDFVAGALANKAFTDEVAQLVAAVQAGGCLNSLAQTLLKTTAPGVPDIYQGSELWCYSLVDPDNRRPVDFELRRRLCAELDKLSPDEIMQRMHEGMPKLWIIRTALALRGEHPEWFGAESSYTPLWTEGACKEHVLAFMRADNSITIVPRLMMSLKGPTDSWRKEWGDTYLTLPAGNWRNRFDASCYANGRVEINELLQQVPVALLVRES